MDDVVHEDDGAARRLSRRRFIAGAGALAGALSWARVDRVSAAELPAGATVPPAFPAGLALYKRRFETWSGEIAVDDVWTTAVEHPADVLTVLRWALDHGYKVRARGFMHTWAPLTITQQTTRATRVLLVDTSALSSMAIVPGSPAAVRVGTGATMEDILAFLHREGHGLASVPAVGKITIGGALAIGGHGAALPALDETPAPGEGFGSLSNQVVSLTAAVWDPATHAYVLRTFQRGDPETSSLLVHLGRAFLTEVQLRVGPARTMRCVSTFDTPASALFAPPASAGPKSFSKHLDQAGRAEAIWFPFTDKPWMKVWTLATTKPRRSRRTTGPYNYVFSDEFPKIVSDLAHRVLDGDGAATPALGQAEYQLSADASLALGERDLWGPAFHTQLYIKATTLRFAECGFAVLTTRGNVQQVLSQVHDKYLAMVAAYRARKLYPINGAVEIRASSLDHPDVVGVPGAEPPMLSAMRPRADHPEWDTAVWVNVLTFAGTKGSYEFYTELEHWCRATFTEPQAAVRVEWSKGWGYTAAGPWTDHTAITTTLPDGFRGAATGPKDWDATRAQLAALDPRRTYSNTFLGELLA